MAMNKLQKILAGVVVGGTITFGTLGSMFYAKYRAENTVSTFVNDFSNYAVESMEDIADALANYPAKCLKTPEESEKVYEKSDEKE